MGFRSERADATTRSKRVSTQLAIEVVVEKERFDGRAFRERGDVRRNDGESVAAGAGHEIGGTAAREDFDVVPSARPGHACLVVAGATGALADGTLENAAHGRGRRMGASRHAAQGGAREDLEDDVGGDGVARAAEDGSRAARSEEHTSELQSPCNLVCRLLLEKKKYNDIRLSIQSR